jgi:hypothetical protein
MPDPERPNDGQVLEQAREAAIDTAVQQLRMIHALKQSPAGGPCGPSTSASPTPDPSDFLADLARVSLESYQGWLRVSATHFDFLVDSLKRLSGKQPATTRPPAIALAATAKIGTPAVAPFVIENPDDVRTEVLFTPIVLRNADGTALTGPIAYRRVGPDGQPFGGDGSLLLEPRECAHVCVEVRGVGPSANDYRGESIVVVGGRVVGRLQLTVTVTP